MRKDALQTMRTDYSGFQKLSSTKVYFICFDIHLLTDNMLCVISGYRSIVYIAYYLKYCASLIIIVFSCVL